ncbi:MAG TPA: hypothetical protein VFC70_02240 [Oscillospiraceae bacterium]|nr:hypothetical protein [Oscillospiraceae bacterium]
MKKNIVFVMHTNIIGQGLNRNFQDDSEYESVFTTDYKDAELYLGDKTPHIAVIEVPDYSQYPLSYCLKVCQRFKKTYSDCKCLLFLTYTYVDDILPEVIEAKREGKIDGFTSANTRIEEVMATIRALS